MQQTLEKQKTHVSRLHKLQTNNEKFDKITYKSAVRSLIYLARYTRPDIAYATGKVEKNSHNR